MGQIDILSTGRGHMEISFDPNDEADKEKCKQTVTDLLAKGYKLVVHEDGEDKPVTSFDPEKCCYTVLEVGAKPDEPPTKEVPAADADATAYRPVAGG